MKKMTIDIKIFDPELMRRQHKQQIPGATRTKKQVNAQQAVDEINQALEKSGETIRYQPVRVDIPKFRMPK